MSQDLFASAVLRWPSSISARAAKEAVAGRAATQMQDGQIIGIGSGSTTYLALWAIGRRAQTDGLNVSVVCSSYETEAAAVTLGLSLRQLGSVEPDWGVDGADEVDAVGRLIKGRGGAMFKEKILWTTARKMFLAVDPSKHVERLGQNFPIPVEIQRDAAELVTRQLRSLGASDIALRLEVTTSGPTFTEGGNLILDARFPEIPIGTSRRIKEIPGVIETGLFEGYHFDAL